MILELSSHVKDSQEYAPNCTDMHSDLSFYLFHSAVHFPNKERYSFPLRLLRTSLNLLFPQTLFVREEVVTKH